jgi:hypothetical protein
MRKQAVSWDAVFSGKAGLLYACYILIEPLEKGVFEGGEFWEKKV